MMVGFVAGEAMAASPGAISPLEDFLLPDKPQGLGFQTQARLTDAIHRQNPTAWKRKTLASLISKYFMFALPLSQKFKDVLFSLTHGDLRDRLQQAIEQHEEEHQRRSDPIQIVRRRYAAAKQVVFLGLEPISAHLDSVPPALVDLLRYSFEEIVSGKLHAIMCVPSREIAIAIWKSTSNLVKARATTNPDAGTAAQLFEFIDKKLVLLELPRLMCVHTTLVFDPHESFAVGYTWYMPWDWRSPVKMPPAVLEAWKTEFLKPVENLKIDGKTITPIARTSIE